ncbi:molybdenum cofactor guanylyltransferase [Halalkalibacter akibai]|uniref:Probable molybdenum cofactor guanylyltransferase n=1 Tax=Halalkalibacter akibai (strain ATCC 43226 / DSM 21942 / CIP 109018 / JCM 9157 / 1139) TaxID=1236973 RepID=W4QX40_HALA3|nr:molybdenum cofactor guanylyltransferase [Halalkalibacter akibai]GAE36218.1 molybdopterin-guanine dinucleotide biosynthesis protein MobA [Halalkalibacter akibai JCM 9157]
MKMVGVVLAGGKSSRFGRPKMFEHYKGIPFYQHSVNALTRDPILDVYIITNNELADCFKGHVSVLVEEEPHNGPLQALVFAFESVQDGDWFFVLAADVPFVTAEFVTELTEHISTDLDVVIPVTNGQQQPLLALYHRRCLPVAKEILATNKRSMKPLLDKVRIKTVAFSETQKDFININTEADWAREQN